MMEKAATTQYPVQELIRRRWSPRAFAPKMVERDVLRSLFEAARWAPSCFGEEPWRYLVATKDHTEDYAKMLGCLVDKNQAWAKAAPVLAVSLAKLTFTRGGKPNRFAAHDVGAASESLALEAVSRGLFVHQMGGIEVEKIRETYSIPADFDILAGLAIGYPGDPESLPEAFIEAEKSPRTRKPLTQVVFSGLWEKAAEIVEDVAND